MSTIAEVGQVAVNEEMQQVGFRRLMAQSWLLRAALVFAGSTAMGLIFMFPLWSEGMGWREDLAQWWGWGLLVPVIMAVDRRLPYSGRQLGRRAAAHAASGLIVTAVYVYVFHFLRVVLGDMRLPGGPHWRILTPANILKIGSGWFLWSYLIYWMILGGLQAYRYYERYMSSQLELERLEKIYSQARLNALQKESI